MDETTRLRMRRGHLKHTTHCSCGRVVHGNGGRAAHSAMHAALEDGHHAVLWYVWPLMFPGHDGKTQRAPTLTEEQAIEAERAQRESRATPSGGKGRG